MLRRAEGATSAEVEGATDWQPHAVRGAFAGALKKRLGLSVTSDKVEGTRVYASPDDADPRQSDGGSKSVSPDPPTADSRLPDHLPAPPRPSVSDIICVILRRNVPRGATDAA